MSDTPMRYRRLFEILGRRLKPEDGVSEDDLLAAERRLGLRIPKALADYYRVAGHADPLTPAFNKLLPPSRLRVQSGKLVFLEEDQGVALWGTAVSAEPDDDPSVYQTLNEEPYPWAPVSDRCSTFLSVMLHWGATFGGALPFVSTAAVDPSLASTLDRGWSFVGEVDGIRAYNRLGAAACLAEWDSEWRLFAGSTTEAGMTAAAAELGVAWETSVA